MLRLLNVNEMGARLWFNELLKLTKLIDEFNLLGMTCKVNGNLQVALWPVRFVPVYS